jgi:hypothetical protein
MPTLCHVLTTIQPFTGELFRLLNIWDTLSLSQTCKAIRSEVRNHPAAFGVVDLRDERVAGVYARLQEATTGVYGFDSYISPVEVFHWATVDTSRQRRLFFPCLGVHFLTLYNNFRVRVLVLDGLQFTTKIMDEVFTELAPKSLEELSLMYTRGCPLKEFVKIVEKVGVGKLKVLRVCKSVCDVENC